MPVEILTIFGMKTPAGTFKNCIKVEETSGIKPKEKCYKTYAPGVGMIQDEDLLLTGYAKAEESISIEDLPPAVRATIEKYAAGGKITEIEKETDKGTILYEAEVVSNGREFDIFVSASGEYLGIEEEQEPKGCQKKDDDEDDEDNDDDEDDDD